MRTLFILATSSTKHNTGIAYQYLLSQAKGEYDVFICDSSEYFDCTGCRCCLKKGKCSLEDDLSIYDLTKYDCFFIICPAYFFGLKADISRFLDRLFCFNLKDKKISILLFTGSYGEDSGIDCIRSRFRSIDRYTGTKTIIRQVVTNDEVLSLADYEAEFKELLRRSNLEIDKS